MREKHNYLHKTHNFRCKYFYYVIIILILVFKHKKFSNDESTETAFKRHIKNMKNIITPDITAHMHRVSCINVTVILLSTVQLWYIYQVCATYHYVTVMLMLE